MKVLSLFDGISCGRVAFERACIAIERYVAYENDPNPIKISQKNYPQIEQCGDVFAADYTKYKGFDIVIGGSPCTHWSIAKNGRETTSDGIGFQLFMQFVRAVRESECPYFLYENNFSIHKDIKAAISAELGVQPIMINSALVSAQSRKREYWTNIPNVGQPADRHIYLKDILQPVTIGSGYILESVQISAADESNPIRCGTIAHEGQTHHDSKQYRVYTTDGKSVTICGQGGGGGAKTGLYATPIPIEDIQPLLPFVEGKLPEIVGKYGYLPEMFNPYNAAELEQKSPTQTANCDRQSNSAAVMVVQNCVDYAPHKDSDIIVTDNSMRCQRRDTKHSTIQGTHVTLPQGKSQTLMTGHIPQCFENVMTTRQSTGKCACLRATYYKVGQRNLEKNFTDAQGYEGIIQPADGKSFPIYRVEGGFITIKGKSYPIKLADGFYIIRKLTPLECERLQTLPDGYTEGVSDTQRYKAIGNGWTVDVIAHILSYLKEAVGL